MKILYEDKDIIVCHKEGGVPVQSARIGQKDMVSILNNYLAEQSEGAGNAGNKRNRRGPEPIRVVHRLDQPVEGVMVFAKNARAAAALSRQITEGRLEKIYRAVCCVTESGAHFCRPVARGEHRTDVCDGRRRIPGEPSMETGDCRHSGAQYELCDMLLKNGRTNTSSVVRAGTKDAKEARLSFTVLAVSQGDDTGAAASGVLERGADIGAVVSGVLERGADTGAVASGMSERGENDGRMALALVEIALDTGRHHQIRVQMAHAGLPLCGDRKYNKEITDSPEHGELALCAVCLSFEHPMTGKRMHFSIKPEKKIFSRFAEHEEGTQTRNA